MTLFGFAALIVPLVGPTLGGWITDSYSWRWVFLINAPVGLLAFAGSYAVLRDSDYLTAQRLELRSSCSIFDSIGLSLLVIVMVCWEAMVAAYLYTPMALCGAAYLYTPMAVCGAAVGLLSLLRNEGGSVGTSLA
jgi:MFS family permease